MLFFREFSIKNALIPLMSRIDLDLKSDPHIAKKICFIESPLKIMKNPFYFTLRSLCFLKIFKVFIMTFWSCRKNDFVRKIGLISKFMTSQPG